MSSFLLRRCITRLNTVGSKVWENAALRSFAASAPHASASIGSVLSSASSANPLKDAMKFMGSDTNKAIIWTYRELETHVNALAAGLQELGYVKDDKIVTLLPPESQEYAITLIAASKLGVVVVACPKPDDPNNVSIDVIKNALNKHQPKALIIGSDYNVASTDQDDEGIVAVVDPIVSALSSRIPLEDAKGLDGLIPLTGKALNSIEYPYLEHIVHTSDRNCRGTITFKSLLVYSGVSPSSNGSASTLLIEVESGSATSEAEILTEAEDLGSKLGLTSDHGAKQGRIVLSPAISQTSIAAMVSAFMNETLVVSPGSLNVQDVSTAENGMVVNP